jgi:hypothetical protein
LSGKNIPPLNAKLTELNKPPIMKKNKNILIIARLIGLRVSAGLIARSVILSPKTNPTITVGMYAISIRYGMVLVSSWICGAKTKNKSMASTAELPKSITLRKEKRRFS